MAKNNNHSNQKETTFYIEKWFKKMGVKVVYAALLLFYSYQSKDTPKWAKNVIIGALAYFVSPIDGIPDLSPFIGFTDDMGILSFGLVTIACYIDKDIRSKAKSNLSRFFKEYQESDIVEVDKIL